MKKKKHSHSIPSNAVKLAREAVADGAAGASIQRQWRAFVREKHLAEALLEAEKAKRALRKRISDLRAALAKACDWAIDAADVIADEGIADPEDGEDVDFRVTITELRKLAKRPEAERHVERRKQQDTKPFDPAPTPDTRW